MNEYKVLFYYSPEDEAYITCVPELPGCMSDGKTIEDAIENTRIVANEWIETAKETGRVIPSPFFCNIFTHAKSYDIAKYILQKLGTIKAMALEKLTYYCKVWSLTWYGKSLIEDIPEAWTNGPVFPELFFQHQYQKFVSERDIKSKHLLSNEEKRFVDMILDAYHYFDGDELSKMTHSEDPWQKARKGIPSNHLSNEKITDAMIIDYYSKCSAVQVVVD